MNKEDVKHLGDVFWLFKHKNSFSVNVKMGQKIAQ